MKFFPFVVLPKFDRQKSNPIDEKQAISELEKLGVDTAELGLDFDPELNLKSSPIAVRPVVHFFCIILCPSFFIDIKIGAYPF